MRYLILLILFSFSFSECDQLNQLQCSSNADCEWVESFTNGNCSNLNGENPVSGMVCFVDNITCIVRGCIIINRKESRIGRVMFFD